MIEVIHSKVRVSYTTVGWSAPCHTGKRRSFDPQQFRGAFPRDDVTCIVLCRADGKLVLRHALETAGEVWQGVTRALREAG